MPGKGATPAGEIRARWAWVEAEVWTERMLTTLEQGKRWPRRKSLGTLKDAIRAKTQRRGQRLPAIITDLNRRLAGWFEYFKHSHRPTFPMLDKWVRLRWRRLLRTRLDGRGRHHGWDHLRWPNAFFTQQGLLSLPHAHTLAWQSSRR